MAAPAVPTSACSIPAVPPARLDPVTSVTLSSSHPHRGPRAQLSEPVSPPLAEAPGQVLATCLLGWAFPSSLPDATVDTEMTPTQPLCSFGELKIS